MRVPTTVVSPTMSSKRARAPSIGVQRASCLVDGCNANLSNCRDYHRRHKVCEAHSKTPMVMVNGQEQRFCQQCSRFHLLAEFDEVKRSCRKRLDGHNRRRRKPQSDIMNTGSLFVNRQGSGFSSYSQIFPAPEPNWETVMKTEKNGHYGHNTPLHFIDQLDHFPGSLPQGYGEAKQFPFFQENDFAFRNRPMEISISQPFLSTISSPESSNRKLFSCGLTRVFDSDCALSLLSSPDQTLGTNLGQSVPADWIPLGQRLVPVLDPYGGLSQYYHSQASSDVSPTGFSCSGMEDEHLGTVLVSDVSDSDLHCQGMFHAGADRTSDGVSQATPFSWK